jgi:signal transduction histidine kinase
VVRVADRLAFGAAAAPYEALADFSRRLRDSPDPASLLPTVAEAAAHAVNARRVTALLHVNAGPDLWATWPPTGPTERGTACVDIPIDAQGDRLGCISVTMPAGHALRPANQRLLTDLAHQAGLAFRNARLTAELSGQVEQLDRNARELTKSRRRLITAGDAERSRLEQAIAGQVLLLLSPLPNRLRQLSRRNDETGLDVASLEPLVVILTAALEALREITRGVFPAQLARSGLPTALGSLLARAGTSGRLTVEASAISRRFDPRIETAAYFCVTEARRELGGRVAVVVSESGDQLRLVISGRDSGALSLSRMRDRVEATGGMVSLTSAEGQHHVEACLPITMAEPVNVA